MANATGTPPDPRTGVSSTRIVLAVVILTSLLATLIMVGFGASYVLNGKPLPLNDEDRTAVVKAADLEPYFDSMLIRTDAEQWSKHERMNGTVVLEYAYHHPEDDRPLVISCRILVTEDEEQSAAEYQRQVEETVTLLPEGEGISRRRRDDLLRAGDTSTCVLSSNAGGDAAAIGFVCRTGRRIFVFRAGGVPMNAQRIILEVVESYSSRLPQYQPL